MSTWNVINLLRTVPDNVVQTVECSVSLSNGTDSVTTVMSVNVPYKAPSDPSFVPFDQLTESQTIQWVQNKLGDVRVAQIEKGLEQSLTEKAKQVEKGLPW
jgi:hypothetical protein